jgi:hypothetical protein
MSEPTRQQRAEALIARWQKAISQPGEIDWGERADIAIDAMELIEETFDVKNEVGTLTVERFRGADSMVNTYLDYTGDLPDGNYQVIVKR